MNDDKLLKLMLAVDPHTMRIPPGVRKIAEAVEAAERERAAKVCDGLTDEAERSSGPEAAGWLEQAAAAIRRGAA